MSRRKPIGLSAIGALTAVVVVMFVIGRIDLTDFITQLAVGLTLLIPVIAYFMFKPEIEKWIRSRKTNVSTTFSSVTKQEQQGTSTVSQVIGNPNSIENGIQHYNTRDELPRFGELLGLAHKKIEMFALTFYIVTLQHIGDTETVINRGVKITFLLLNPDSTYLQKHAQSLHAGKDMKYQIEKSHELLCDLRNRLDTSLKKKLIIKAYDSDTKHSITVIDGKIIKVEDRPIGSDSKSRPNHLTFKKDNKDFFKRFLREHNGLEGKQHGCA